MLTILLGIAAAAGVTFFLTGVRVLQEYERAVVFRFGRARKTLASAGEDRTIRLWDVSKKPEWKEP